MVRRRRIVLAALVTLGVVVPGARAQAADDPAVSLQQAAGNSSAAIQSAVAAFRAELGTVNTAPGSQGAGRREINWDGTPDQFSSPNALPPDFFNVTVPRGVVFSTTGDEFRVSGTPGVAPVEFDELDPTSSSRFTTFSAPRLFTAVGSRILEVDFFVPGSTTPATTNAFGAVFTDVDRAVGTKIEYFGEDGTSLGTFPVPASPGSETLSFLGVRFLDERIAKVRIVPGTRRVGVAETRRRDIVAMDDFIFGEPLPG
jgi:hypothetical protein